MSIEKLLEEQLNKKKAKRITALESDGLFFSADGTRTLSPESVFTPTDMVVCKCGAAVPVGTKICPNCGRVIQ